MNLRGGPLVRATLVATALALAAAPPAGASVGVLVTGHTLTAAGGDRGELLQVYCGSDGFPRVSGALPANQLVPCSRISEIQLVGGEGPDVFDTTLLGDDFRGVGRGSGIELLEHRSAIGAEGFGGDDTFLSGKAFVAAFSGGPGDDVLQSRAVNTLAFGGAGSDRLNGGGFSDLLIGEGGADRLRGRAGPDLLIGAGGRDTIRGDAGKDLLDGGPSRDRLFGGGGPDFLAGGRARDLLRGGQGKDKRQQDGQLAIGEFLFGPNRAEVLDLPRVADLLVHRHGR